MAKRDDKLSELAARCDAIEAEVLALASTELDGRDRAGMVRASVRISKAARQLELLVPSEIPF